MNKKIASDISFIYIEWLFQELREKFSSVETFEEKQLILKDIQDDQCRDIFLNFFIKIAITNNLDREENNVIKRSLYCLNKLFIIWPDMKFNLESIQRHCRVPFLPLEPLKPGPLASGEQDRQDQVQLHPVEHPQLFPQTGKTSKKLTLVIRTCGPGDESPERPKAQQLFHRHPGQPLSHQTDCGDHSKTGPNTYLFNPK